MANVLVKLYPRWRKLERVGQLRATDLNGYPAVWSLDEDRAVLKVRVLHGVEPPVTVRIPSGVRPVIGPSSIEQWCAACSEIHQGFALMFGACSVLQRPGRPYESPSVVVEQLTAANRTDNRTLQQRRATEIKIDVRCDFKAHLSATALNIRREYAQHLDPADRAELMRVSTLFDAAERHRAHRLRPQHPHWNG